MMFLWNCLKMGTESEKLLSICRKGRQSCISVGRTQMEAGEAGDGGGGVEIRSRRSGLVPGPR